MVPIDPDSFTCPVHHVDLTAHVLRALADPKPQLAYRGAGIRLRSRPPKKPFKVAVTCPGDATAGKDPHPQLCEGQYWT